jgi:taurine dehydrogenase small subunit
VRLISPWIHHKTTQRKGSQTTTEQETLDLVDRISAAFAAHDTDAMLSFFASQDAFVNAVGPNHFGASYKGHPEIRSYFEPMCKNASDVSWDKSDIRVAGDKAYAQWRRHATLANGEIQDWLGIDVYTFQGWKMLKKDTYIKVVG